MRGIVLWVLAFASALNEYVNGGFFATPGIAWKLIRVASTGTFPSPFSTLVVARIIDYALVSILSVTTDAHLGTERGFVLGLFGVAYFERVTALFLDLYFLLLLAKCLLCGTRHCGDAHWSGPPGHVPEQRPDALC